MEKETKQKLLEFDRQRQAELFKKAEDAVIKLRDLTKTESRTYTVFSKDLLRNYFKNPYSYQTQLRNLSRYFYRVVNCYRRIIHYNTNFFDLSAYSIIPVTDLTEEIDEEGMLQSYQETAEEMEKMNLKTELWKVILTCFIEDVAYGITYEDDDGWMVLLFDPDYAKISSVNYDGTLNWAMDMSYWASHTTQLEYYGEPFVSMYAEYQKDPTNMRWQEVPVERSLCFKIGISDPLLPLPPYMGLFEELIDLTDLRNIQSVKDELSVYKMVIGKLETISGSTVPDDFTVDPETAIQYFSRMAEGFPDTVGFGITPTDVEVVSFPDDDTSDTNKISSAMQNLFDSSGGAQILYSSNISGTTAFMAAIRSDGEYALNPLLGEIEKYVNRHLKLTLNNPGKVVFMHVTPFTKSDYKDSILKSSQYGIPDKIAVATLDGFSPLEVLSMQRFENDVLKLHENWRPLQSSFTSSGVDATETDPVTGGRPKTDGELTDEGDKTRDKA